MEGSVLSFLKAEWKVSDTEPTEPLVFLAIIKTNIDNFIDFPWNKKKV